MSSRVNDLLQHIHNEFLKAVASNVQLDVIANKLCQRVENFAPEIACSILIIDDRGRLHPLAAPSLPASYSNLLEGVEIGPSVGSCGTAAYRGEPVVVTDIASDPLWRNYSHLVLPLGLKACWSTPIKGRDGRVVGTFAFYYKTKRGPNTFERKIVETCAHLCAVAIELDQIQKHNTKLLSFDALTGLLNRAHFDETVRERVGSARPFGLILVDIDHLKTVNDTMGHGVGDRLIVHVAALLTEETALKAFRLGGDEFAILVDECCAHNLRAIAERLLSASRAALQVDMNTLIPNVTIGGALFDGNCYDADTLRQNADFALYHAKETNRGGYVEFHPDMRTSMLKRMQVLRSVDRALAQNRILAHYQPIVKMSTSEIVGLEALARMKKCDNTIVSAANFHEAFSDPKLAAQFTSRMLKQVAGDVRGWLDAGIPIQHVGINVTTGDFQNGDLENKIIESFGDAGVPLKHIILEVNESVFISGHDQMIPNAVKALRDKGILVALDDFGTGFASLKHLITFPVDIIKIDKSFIDRLLTDKPSSIVAGAIIDIAHRLGIKVVAEGIENQEQAQALRKLGCNLGQGFYFAEPCSRAITTELLISKVQSTGGQRHHRQQRERQSL